MDDKIHNRPAWYRIIGVIAVIVCFAFLGVFYYSHLTRYIGTSLGADDCIYITLGKALASGRGYVHINDPDAPPCVKYPFLFPLTLASIIFFFGENYLLMHVLVISCLYLAAIFFFLFLYKKIGMGPALLLCLYVFTLMEPYGLLMMILSEFPFLLFTVLCIFFFDRFGRERGHRSMDLVMTVVFGLAAYFTRSAGLALVLAVVVELYFRPLFRQIRWGRYPAWAVCAIVFALPLLIWSGRNAVSRRAMGESQYVGQVLLKNNYLPDEGLIRPWDLLRRYKTNIREYSSAMTLNLFEIVNQQDNEWLKIILAAVLSVPVVFGFFVMLLRGPPLLGIYMIFYFIILLHWPFPEYDRFLFPMLPWLGLCLYYGCVFFAERSKSIESSRYKNVLPLLLPLLLLVADIYFIARIEQHRFKPRWYPPQPISVLDAGTIEKVVDWSQTASFWFSDENLDAAGQAWVANEVIKRILPKNAVILCRSPEFVYLNTGRRAVIFPFTENQQKIMSCIAEKKITHVMLMNVTWQDRQFLEPVLRARPSLFHQVYGSRISRVGIYEVTR